jgi:putative oxidoreductase
MTPDRLRDVALLVLRLAFGGLMLVGHGAGKVGRVLEGNFAFADPLGVGPAPSLVMAAFAEAVCAGLVVLGVTTRAALVPLMVTMIVAVFIQHAADPFGKKELGLLYLAGYLALFLTGPGRYSLSALVRRSPKGGVLAFLFE